MRMVAVGRGWSGERRSGADGRGATELAVGHHPLASRERRRNPGRRWTDTLAHPADLHQLPGEGGRVGAPRSALALPLLLWLLVLAMILYLLPSACDIWRTRTVG